MYNISLCLRDRNNEILGEVNVKTFHDFMHYCLNYLFFNRLDITDALKDVYYNEIYERMDPMVKKVTYSSQKICIFSGNSILI